MGLTVATMWQATVCRRFGMQRLLLANELVEPSALGWAVSELADPGFSFLSYVDSRGQVEHATAAMSGINVHRPLDALLEVGYPGGRAGCRQAAEVWASVLARPEPGLAILDAGQRDVPVDTGMPELLRVRRGGAIDPAPPAWRIESANDQHLYLAVGNADALAPGDLVSLDILHPCAFFDKWTWIPMVDSDYRVTDAIRTYF